MSVAGADSRFRGPAASVESVPRFIDSRLMTPYRWIVAIHRSHAFNAARRRYWRLTGRPEIDWHAADYLRSCVAGRSVVDSGGRWGINGEHSFLAEELGASRVVLVDKYKTPEFEKEHDSRASAVEFLDADATDPELVEKIGVADVVWCFGVMYHHPSPYTLFRALRRLCGDTLVLEGFTAPEVPGLRQVGFYIPYLADNQREMWRVPSSCAVAVGVDTGFEPDKGYANNFWFLTPSSVQALLQTAGFEVRKIVPSPSGPLRRVFVCSTARVPDSRDL
jgi:hypothetical protein